jgi:hypothetical protein
MAPWQRQRMRGSEVANAAPDHHLSAMKILELSDVEAEALARGLAGIIDSARYPLSPRIRTLRAIPLNKLRPEPAREPLPPLKTYAPPSKGRYW